MKKSLRSHQNEINLQMNKKINEQYINIGQQTKSQLNYLQNIKDVQQNAIKKNTVEQTPSISSGSYM